MKRIIILLAFVLPVFFSCGNGTSTDTNDPATTDASQIKLQETYYTEVIAKHDVVMPMTNEVVKLRRKIKKYGKANPEMEAGLKAKMDTLMEEMEESEEGMMQWMAAINPGYKAAKETGDHEKVMTYLKEEQKRMDLVQQMTEKSIADAKAFLAGLEAQ